jgi:hypothetical protein
MYRFRLADGGSSSAERGRRNAAWLAKALYTAIAILMTICNAHILTAASGHGVGRGT